MEKIIYYYLQDDVTLMEATLNADQAYYAVMHCHDLNSLHAFIKTVTVWKEVKQCE